MPAFNGSMVIHSLRFNFQVLTLLKYLKLVHSTSSRFMIRGFVTFSAHLAFQFTRSRVTPQSGAEARLLKETFSSLRFIEIHSG